MVAVAGEALPLQLAQDGSGGTGNGAGREVETDDVFLRGADGRKGAAAHHGRTEGLLCLLEKVLRTAGTGGYGLLCHNPGMGADDGGRTADGHGEHGGLFPLAERRAVREVGPELFEVQGVSDAGKY